VGEVSSRPRELHHVGIAVPSLESALPLYTETLGLRAHPVRELADQKLRVAFLESGATRVELVEPLDPGSGIGRFLAERGRPTLHHVCFVADDLAATLRDLAARGVELIDQVPRRGAEGDVAFLHPRAGDGVLIELIDRASIAVRSHT
jgi:methylmalonyl-CoA/ethylmalonyl-CoA epimerase